MKLFVSIVLVVVANLASANTVARILSKSPRLPHYNTKPGFTYHYDINITSQTPSSTYSEVSHSIQVHLSSDYHAIVSVPLLLPKIIGEHEDEHSIESFIEDIFVALDAISRSRDPLFKSLRLASWAHFASIDHQQLAKLHNDSLLQLGTMISHRKREMFYKKLAFCIETLCDALLADEDFLIAFKVGGYSKKLTETSAQQRNDEMLATHIYHLNHQIVPRKAGGLRAKWEEYRLIRQIAKLPHGARAKYAYLIQMVSLNGDQALALDFVARRALMLNLYSSLGSAITERLHYVNPPYLYESKKLSEDVDLDSRLWRKLYILQKSTSDDDLFSRLHSNQQ